MENNKMIGFGIKAFILVDGKYLVSIMKESNPFPFYMKLTEGRWQNGIGLRLQNAKNAMNYYSSAGEDDVVCSMEACL